MKVYVDSSIVLRRLLDQPGAFQNWSKWEYIASSELLRVEAFRSLHRMQMRRRLTDSEMADILDSFRKYTSSFEMVPIQANILERAASAFPTPLGTLDAIHLATALIWTEFKNEPLTFLTHDVELGIAARACGLEVRMKP